MKKVLLCSPYYREKETTTCGVANWTRNIMSKIYNSGNIQVELLPYDRSVDLNQESTAKERFVSGVKDYLGVILKTRKRIKEERYDIIHVSTSASWGLVRDYLLAKMAHKRGVKIVYHFHFGRMPEILDSSNWESKLMRKVLKLCDAAIVMDAKSYNSLKHHGYNNVFFLPNPISDSRLKYIDETLPGLSRKKGCLLFVGHVVRNKGVYELVEACSLISNIKLKIVGKVFDSTKHDLEEIATSKKKENWLEFLGEIPHNDVLKEMATCDIFVLPTYSEGFPNVILESMSCGCPIIASDVGAIREMLDIDNKPCGVIVQPKSVSDLINAILQLKDDAYKKQEFGLLAKKRIHEQYTVDVVSDKLFSIWNQI